LTEWLLVRNLLSFLLLPTFIILAIKFIGNKIIDAIGSTATPTISRWLLVIFLSGLTLLVALW